MAQILLVFLRCDQEVSLKVIKRVSVQDDEDKTLKSFTHGVHPWVKSFHMDVAGNRTHQL